MKTLVKNSSFKTLLILVALFGLAGLINPSFLQINNIFQTINGSVVYGMVALGMAFVIFIGEIDVSVGAVLGLSAAITGNLVLAGMNYFIILLIVILVGAVIGVINAIGVNILKIPSIIMTLGTNGVIRGLIFVYTGGKWIEGLAFDFKSLAQLTVNRTLSYFYLALIALVLGALWYLASTKTGKTFKAVGDNYDGAKLLGLPVTKVKILSFVLCSVLASIGGYLYTSRVGFVTPTAGVGYEMVAVAACVIGGINLTGGVGNVIGSLLGSILMASITRVLVFIGLPSTFDNTITGLMLITVVVIGSYFNKRSLERLRVERLHARVEGD